MSALLQRSLGVLLAVAAGFALLSLTASLPFAHSGALTSPSTPYATRLLSLGLVLNTFTALCLLWAAWCKLRLHAPGKASAISGLLCLATLGLALLALSLPATTMSAVRVSGLVLPPTLLMAIALAVSWLLGRSVPHSGMGATLLLAITLGGAALLGPSAAQDTCPDGCVEVSVPGPPVESCWFFLFCDTEVYYSIQCREAADTTQACVADVPDLPPEDQTGGSSTPPPEEDDDNFVFVCLADYTAMQIYGWLCDLVVLIVFEYYVD